MGRRRVCYRVRVSELLTGWPGRRIPAGTEAEAEAETGRGELGGCMLS